MISPAHPLPEIHVFEPPTFKDDRGSFVKTFHDGQWNSSGIHFSMREEFFSISKKGVLRGMHFQLPPHEHQKIVYCIAGTALDVILDLRRGGGSYGKAVAIELSAENRRVVHIPVGFAHGFAALQDDSCLVYKTDAVHAPERDAGIRWDSFGFDWPVLDPILSARDSRLPGLNEFVSPF